MYGVVIVMSTETHTYMHFIPSNDCPEQLPTPNFNRLVVVQLQRLCYVST